MTADDALDARLEELVFRYLEAREAADPDRVLDDLCRVNPDLSRELRQAVDALRRSGLTRLCTWSCLCPFCREARRRRS